MKRVYEKPNGVVVEMSFEEHIAASGGSTPGECTTRYEYVGEGCQDKIVGVFGYDA